MISIITLFSIVVSKLVRQSYKEYESVYKAMGIVVDRFLLTVGWTAVPMANPLTIAYNSAASTDCTIRWHLMELQWITFPPKSDYAIGLIIRFIRENDHISQLGRQVPTVGEGDVNIYDNAKAFFADLDIFDAPV